MELVANIIFFVTFLGMCIIISKILLDSNFEKLFKQGRTSSIRVAYFIVIFLFSVLIAWGFRELIFVIYNILKI